MTTKNELMRPQGLRPPPPPPPPPPSPPPPKKKKKRREFFFFLVHFNVCKVRLVATMT